MQLTRDAFLGGRLHLWQPATGYRAGIDPVLLAAAIPARVGQSALDLGCGVGTALFCLGTRVPGLDLAGVEILPAYADLARRNAAANGIDARIFTADIAALPPDLRQRQFDHVFANPPYFPPGSRNAAPDAGRESGRGEALPLPDWIDAAIRRVAPQGRLTLIQRIDRLPEILANLSTRLGGVTVLPVAARTARLPEHALIAGTKASRARFRLLNPLILHEGLAHTDDAESYTPEVQAVLRNAGALEKLLGIYRFA